MEGGGGTITHLDGTIELKYAWGLGKETNNQAKALALLQGLKQLTRKGIIQSRVIRDSQSLIFLMISKSLPKEFQLNQIICRIHNIASKFQLLLFFHVLCRNNIEANSAANRAVALNLETLVLGDHVELVDLLS